MNHGRTNVSIRFCPNCGEELNPTLKSRCDNAKHAQLLKNRNAFCTDCGKKLFVK